MNYKSLFAFLILFLSFNYSNAQEKFDVTLRNDTVFNNGKPQFLAKFRPGPKGTRMYSLYSMDGKMQAILTMTEQGDQLRFSGRFPLIYVIYDCLYPKMEILTLMDSYVRSKVMVGGIAQKEGLQSYCKERGLPLREIPIRKVMKPGMDASLDSALAQRAKEQEAKKIEILIKNNSKDEVSIFVGDSLAKEKIGPDDKTVPFREGRIEKIAGGTEMKIVAFIGEKIGISSKDNNLYDCRPVVRELKQLKVRSNGKSLE
ncbi:hypothetical protein BH11BAC2_BH11BAC2_01400 [soil metagenome]